MITRMPARHLWTGAARRAYMQMSVAAPYGSLRENQMKDLTRDLYSERILILGAGPDVRSEAGVLESLVPISNTTIVVHDIDEDNAEVAAKLLASHLAERAKQTHNRIVSVGGDLLHLTFTSAVAGSCFDVAMLLGYTFGNFTDGEAEIFLRTLAARARAFLFDVPLAWRGDLRLCGQAFDPEGEIAWLNAAHHDWRGHAPLDAIQSIVQSEPDGYVIRILTGDAELIRFRRRTAAGWLAFCEQNGWRLRCASVTDGTPRLAALLVSDHQTNFDLKMIGRSA